jgi:hypothetical protein
MLMSQPLHRAIEFHDSELAAVEQIGAAVVLSFSAIYIHESIGEPGVDAGVGWYQPCTFTISDAHIVSGASLPSSVADGSIRLGDTVHQNGLPSVSCQLEGPIELSLLLTTAETLLVRGASIMIELSGQPSHIEQFSP